MMSQRVLRLPFRPLSSRGQWVCKRCLANQAESASPTASLEPPLRSMRDPAKEDIPDYDPSVPSAQRDYRLTKTDFYLKKALPHKIPVQYLQHTKNEILPPSEKAQWENTKGHKKIVGVVVRSGRMDKTVTVRVPRQQWNRRIKKYFDGHEQHLVHDPNNSLITGDVVELHRLRVSAAVHHVVANIVSPFGKPIAERPPVPTADERLSKYKEQRFAKLHRRSLRREAAKGNPEAIRELRQMGLDPGKGVEPLKGETANLQQGVGKVRTPTKGAIRGAKGQKLPEGVLPGGKAEVGKINKRAQQNKDKAMKFEEQAESNILEAKEKGEKLEQGGIETDTDVPTKGQEKA